jgi:hypothetical protein
MPAELPEYVARGVDMMDCVLPSRNARNGCLFTSEGRVIVIAEGSQFRRRTVVGNLFEPAFGGLGHRKAGTATNSRLWNWLAVPGLPPREFLLP